MWTLYLLLVISFRTSYGHYEQPKRPEEQIVGQFGETRRILRGTDITDTRPYMVYLRAAPAKGHSAQVDPNWLCGGVIIHPRYVLTSAACIEDVVHFYVVSGTHRWLPVAETNECITNGATRAVWKCVPKTYNYDGGVFNNIRWMVNDIAVVMVESEFNFKQRVKGCDFIPQSISFNNESQDLEHPGTLGTIAGWGSTEKFTDVSDLMVRSGVNSPNLMEAQVIVVKKASCKNLWLPRYHRIIEDYMICGKNIPTDELHPACDDQVECRQLVYSEEELTMIRRGNKVSDHHLLRSLAQFKKKRKLRKMRKSGGSSFGVIEGANYGGFCENDHGGPLIIGHGRTSMVIGIISAYRNVNNSKSCFGPFLYSSVFNNRHLINCALFKNIGSACTAVLRSTSTVLDEEHLDWSDHERQPHSKKRGKKKKALRSDKKPSNDTAPALAGDHAAVGRRRPDTPEENDKT